MRRVLWPNDASTGRLPVGGQVAVVGVIAGASTCKDHQIAWQVCAGSFWLRRAMIVDARSVERVLR